MNCKSMFEQHLMEHQITFKLFLSKNIQIVWNTNTRSLYIGQNMSIIFYFYFIEHFDVDSGKCCQGYQVKPLTVNSNPKK